MPTLDEQIKEIRALKTKYEELYFQVRKEQKTDKTYIDDTFPVPEVKSPHEPMRLGMGAEIVDSPAEQIITQNPQAFIDIIRGDKEAKNRIGKLINDRWIPILKRQNPNPYKEFVKNLLARGEAFIKLAHNESWVTGDRIRNGLPVKFLLPDPMVIYASPEEDDNGVPARVIVFYERQPQDVIVRYPDWHNPMKAGEENKKKEVQWVEYWGSIRGEDGKLRQVRYFEADGEPVLKGGVQDNIYGFPPFVRKYSGFGRRSPDGKLASLIISDIKLNRDLIRTQCAIGSDIASIMHLFAHKPRTLILPPGQEVSQDQLNQLEFGAYVLNVLNLPEGAKFDIDETELPSAEAFAFFGQLTNMIREKNPFVMAGFPSGSSGRQQDMSNVSAMRRYDSVIENTEHAWATAFEMALKICYKIPTLQPKELHKNDLKATYECEVKLKADDPAEEDRKATLGDRL